MSIVTKTGDKGETGLFGGKRVRKDDARMHAIGTVDELNASLGVALSGDKHPTLYEQLVRVQNVLFRMGADLATPTDQNAAHVPRMEQAHISELEAWIAELETTLPEQRAFILPSGGKLSAHLHLSRAICRRAERHLVTLAGREDIGPHCSIYLNRLSDYLFLAARSVSTGDVEVKYE